MAETPSRRPSAPSAGGASRARPSLNHDALTTRADDDRRRPPSTPVRAALFSPARAHALGTPQRLARILDGSAPLSGSTSTARTPLTARGGRTEIRLSDLASIESIGLASAQMRAERKRHRSPSSARGFTPARAQSATVPTLAEPTPTPATVSPADTSHQPPRRTALDACVGKKPKRLDLASAPDSCAPADEPSGAVDGRD
jgi:hypothetical protein